MLSLCFVSGDMCGIVSAENGNVSCFQNPNNQESCLLTCYPGYTVVSQGTNSHQFHCNKTKGWDGGVPSVVRHYLSLALSSAQEQNLMTSAHFPVLSDISWLETVSVHVRRTAFGAIQTCLVYQSSVRLL